jgi:hypothetical protein
MDSKLAKASRDAMIELCKRMTPEERLKAFVEHSRQLALLHQAGKEARIEQARNEISPKKDSA